MNRRTFLKSVPALAMLASAKTAFSAEANTATSAAPQGQPVTEAEGVIKFFSQI